MSSGKKSKNPVPGIILLAMVTVFSAFILLYWIFSDSIDTETVMYGTIEETIKVKAGFIRDEEYIEMPSNGMCILNNTDGERVAFNGEIATVLTAPTLSLYNEITAKETEIYKAMLSNETNILKLSEQTKIIEADIAEKLFRTAEACAEGNYSLISQYKSDINNSILQKVKLYSQSDSSTSYITSLKNELDMLQTTLKTNTSIVRASKPCMVAYSIFDTNRICEFDSVDTLTAKFLEDFETKILSLDYTQEIKQSTKICRAIYDFNYYIAFTVDKKIFNKLDTEKNIELRFKELGITIPGEIYKASESDGKYVVILKTNKCMAETANSITAEAELVIKSTSGLKIRSSAVINYSAANSTGELFILSKAGAAEKRSVKILAQDQYFVIFEESDNKYDDSILLYDSYIPNPTNITEGQLIK